MNNHAQSSSSRTTLPRTTHTTSPWRFKKTNQNNNVDLGPSDLSTIMEFPSVEERVAESLEVWAKELRALFDHAKERFGDVSWESEDDPSGSSRVWGHKAVIYARAPKPFKDRYFMSRPFSRSPSSLRSPSPSFHPPFSSGQSSPHSSTAPNSIRRPNPSPHPSSAARGSTLSVNTIRSEGTIRANGDAVLRLTHGDTPELFTAQLEWLYTGEGFGDVVEWISAEDDTGIGGSIRDSLGRRGNLSERRDKLGQDLTYIWRSKLYADARIHLAPPLPTQEDSSSDDSEDSTDSLSSTAIFTAHRFILASRSPYFASVLLNGSHFRPHTADIHLPTPPFSPAALHFCLGYIYAGHLDFSNRTFDLVTAFAIHKAAAYLQLDTLIAEIESRIAHDFCHDFDLAKIHCRRCPTRIARVWRFASSPDVGAVRLREKSRAYIVKRWGESWSRDVATADPVERQALVDQVVKTIGPHNVIAAFKSLEMIKSRIDSGVRIKGRASTVWVDPLEDMLSAISTHARAILIDNFSTIAEGAELWSLVSGKGFNHDLLEVVCNAVVESVGTAQECVEGPRIYQALISSILLKVDPDTLETALSPRSKGRIQIEEAKEGVLGHIRRRWMQVRDGGGFDGLEPWSLKEISHEIEVPEDDLLTDQIYTPPKIPRVIPTTGGRLPIPRASFPRATPSVPSPSEAKSTRSISARSQASTMPRPSGLRQSAITPDKSGLRTLRLSSSASTSSANSPPSVPARREPAISISGPQARSPTAERQGRTVSVGSAARRAIQNSSPSGSASSSPRSVSKPMSGPPRPLVTRASANQRPKDADTKSLAPSLASVRTTRTAKSTATIRQTPNSSPSKPGLSNGKSPVKAASKLGSATPTPRTPRKSTEETIRSRTSSAASTASTRRKAVRKEDLPPPLPHQAGPSSAPLAAKIPTPSIAPSLRNVPAPSIAPSIRSTAASIRTTAPSVKTLAASIDSRARVPSIASTRTVTRPTAPPKSPTRLPQPTSRAIPLVTQAAKAKESGKSADRLRTTSQRSTASARSQHPPPSRGTNLAPALPIGVSQPSVRSASSSTDGTEARTPRLSETLMPAIEPLIRRDGSDSSGLDASGPSSSLTSSPTKLPTFKTSESSPSKQSIKSPSGSSHSNLPPPVSIARPGRKISTSSVKSSNSYRAHPASAFDPPKRPFTVRLPKKEVPVGTVPFAGKGVALHIGIPCIVSLKAKRARFRALVKYIGYMKGSRGPWLGIETEDLDRFGVPTLVAGVQNGTHYFHLSDPGSLADVDLDARLNRQRRMEVIRESLGKPIGLGLGLGSTRAVAGLPVAGPYGLGVDTRGAKRSKSPIPYADGYGLGAMAEVGGGRVLFVRPSEVVFVLGAE